MPAPDGYELALHVRRTPALAHIPVILLTGAFDPVDHARARDAGCAGVLVKPFDPQMLIARVRQLLQARRPVPGAPVDDPSAQKTATDLNQLDVQARVSEPPIPDAPPAASLPAEPALSAASKAAEVDDYFARLDRAFATLQAPGEGDRRMHAAGAHPDTGAAAGGAASAADALDAAGTLTPARSDADGEPTPATASLATAAAEDHSARPSAAPTLAGRSRRCSPSSRVSHCRRRREDGRRLPAPTRWSRSCAA